MMTYVMSILYKFIRDEKEYGNRRVAISSFFTKVTQIKSDKPKLRNNSSFNIQVNNGLTKSQIMAGCRLGIDSHADTSCAGRHFRVTERHEGTQYSVAPFHDEYSPIKNVDMVNGLVAVDDESGGGFILEMNNFLDFTSSMMNSIVVPMQLREFGVIVDDVPKKLCPYKKSSQSIYFPEEMVRIPIEYHGPVPYIKIRYPTDQDLKDYRWIKATSPTEWDPYKERREISNISNSLDPQDFWHDESDYLDYLIKSVCISTIGTRKKGTLSSEVLARFWKIGVRSAKRTLEATTHNSVRTNEGHLSRRFRTDVYQRRYRHLYGDFAKFYTDTLFFKVQSLNLDTCAQLYCNKAGYIKIYSMKSKSQAHDTLTTFIHEVGVPTHLHSDYAKEIFEGEMAKKMKRYEIRNTLNEPHSPWQNYAEDCIRIVKNWTRSFMQSTNTPIRLYYYALRYTCNIKNRTASNSVRLDGRTPYEVVHGNTPDISEYATFRWYEIVWYWDPNFNQKQKLGRWIGVAEHIGAGITYYVLNKDAIVLARSTVISLSKEQRESKEIIKMIQSLDENIHMKIGDYEKSIVRGESIDPNFASTDFISGDEEEIRRNEDVIENQELISSDPHQNIFEIPESDKNEYHDELVKELTDKFIGSDIVVPRFDNWQKGRIKSRKRTADGMLLVGKENSEPLLDTRIYEVEFTDGGIHEYSTNTIIESIHSGLQDFSHSDSVFESIIDHRKDIEAVTKEDAFVEVNGRKRRVVTTKGWQLKLQWKNGSVSWMHLKDMKDAFPIDVAEYAVAHNIDSEPAFAWWVKAVLDRRERIISKLRSSRRNKKTVKYGIVIPDDLKHAEELDRENDNDGWKQAIEKELSKIRVAFKVIDADENIPVGSRHINYHMIFDVKADLTKKARLVAGGHLNKGIPHHTTYSSVVSRDSVRICLLIASLNGLDVLCGDVSNAYLNAIPRESCHVTINDPWLFGASAVGKTAIICRALYGMKSSGASWRDAISTALHYEMGFTQCLADNDVWYKKDFSDDIGWYYSYICIYVDDILIISKKTKAYMESIGKHFEIKPDSVQIPTRYLGADLKCKTMENGESVWLVGGNSYLKEALRVVEGHLVSGEFKVAGKGLQPFSNVQYRPEMDVTQFCTEKQINLYQHLIGMLRWLVELGRVDILLETSLLSSYLSSPRIGHLHQALHIFHYLKKHPNSWLAMDPMKLEINWRGAPEESPEIRRKLMREIYRDAFEDIPTNCPEPLGKKIQLNVYCDSDHAGNRITRRSQSGILIYGNMAPIEWYSKRQNTVEASTFGSEYNALRIATEKIKSLRYKLRMMGVSIDGPANVFVDNMSVVNSSVRPENVLKKKHLSIAYNLVRECFAAEIMDIYFVKSKDNLADVFTKVLPSWKRKIMFETICW